VRTPSALLMVIFVLLTFKCRSSKLAGIKSGEFGQRYCCHHEVLLNLRTSDSRGHAIKEC